MKITDCPFNKYSYEGRKSGRNCLEVAAVAEAARRLGVQFSIIDAVCHAYYVRVEPELRGDLLLAAAKLKKSEVRRCSFFESL